MCIPQEHPDPARCPSSTSSVAVDVGPSDPLTESPLPLRPPSHDLAPSNLPGHSAPFNLTCPDDVPASLPDKGKANDPPPTLPPLSFSPSGFELQYRRPVVIHTRPVLDSTRASSPRAGVEAQAATVTIPDDPVVWYPDNHNLDGIPGSRGIGRSYSSPFPKSALDVVPQVDFEDKYIPLPLQAQDLFDEMLPRELRLRVFSALISLHEEDHEQLKKSGKWSVLVATSSKNRWVGRNRAVRELVKLSRVSKLWRTLVFDGQLWQNVDLRAFPSTFLPSLVQLSGDLCVRPAPIVNFTYTQLTAITLQGSVTNATFDVLALCSQLASLNMSRCANIDGDGVRAFGATVMARGARLALRELWLCGLHMIDDDALATLGKAAPHLEVLDLSYCRSLHNSCFGGIQVLGETISLTSRQTGRDPWDTRRYTRRVTALRHLSLSSCTMLTDTACSNLAYSVPRLELLELAGIGHTLKDDGLKTASDITDAVLEVLTPEPVVEGSTPSKTTTPPQPGHALEHLTVSSATNLTNDAFRALIRGCSNLRVLEADSTSISGTVLKEFVRQVCDRGINDAGLVVVDCRSVGERAIKDVVANSRPRKGWRSWEARKLGYLDGRDGEDLKVGQDECDEKRVVIKSFYSWQTVDAVRHVRERRKKTNKKSQCNSEQLSEPEDGVKLLGRMRWWVSGSRTSSGNSTPGEDSDRDGCVVM
ncbi:RNI-like protein [Boletus edulis]|nr:RNI-like protein [Boletus edulis]